MTKELKLSDQVIGQLRELLQLSLLTKTNFVDNARALRVKESSVTPGLLILTEAYTLGWNAMAEDFHKQAQIQAEQMNSTLAGDGSSDDEEEDEILISKNPETGKLFGIRQKIKN